MKSAILTSLLALLIFNGCNSSQPDPNIQPDWVLNPNINGNKAATGSSNITYDQKTNSQRTNAIVRGLAELSNQLGMKVGSSTKLDCTVINDVEKCRLMNSITTTGSNKVSATAKAWWKDPYSNELFVWMVLD